jgi:hypothetical protein
MEWILGSQEKRVWLKIYCELLQFIVIMGDCKGVINKSNYQCKPVIISHDYKYATIYTFLLETNSRDTNIMFLDIIHRPVFIWNITLWRLDSVSVFRWNLLSLVQPIQLVFISGHLQQHKLRYTNQAQHKLSARAKTNIKTLRNSTCMRLSTRLL